MSDTPISAASPAAASPALALAPRWARWLAAAALLGVSVLSTGCEVLYDTGRQAEWAACDKQVSQSQVTECRRRLTAADPVVRKARADRADAADKPTAASTAPADKCIVMSATGQRLCPN